MKRILLLFMIILIGLPINCYEKKQSTEAILPLIGYSENTSLLAGIKYIKPGIIGSSHDLDTLFVYTLKNNLIIKNKLSRQEGIPYWINLSYINYPDNFYGIGNDTKTKEYDVFISKYYELCPGIQYNLSNEIYCKLEFIHKDIKIKTDNPEYALTSNQIGKDGGFINICDISLAYDLRDYRENASSGSLHEVKYSLSNSSIGSDYDFSKIKLDSRYFLNFKNNRVLAFQLLAKAAKGSVPFYELPALGGEENLRGFNSGRLRDKVSIHLGSEYRFPVYQFNKIDVIGITFIDTGRVYKAIDDIKFNNMYMAYGGGLRLILSPTAIVRFDVGFSYEGIGLNLTFGNTF